MNLTKIPIRARLLLVLLAAKTVRSQENEVKLTIFDDKSTLDDRTKFIFYDKK